LNIITTIYSFFIEKQFKFRELRCVAAAESAIGLAILVAYYRIRGTFAVELIHLMKG
jgi:NADH:ubiquinone oxidoreductase subunit K